ncbi:MAG: hypothetical protein MRK00_09325 [Nitrosomonas sp.]|nr:hypothetical protein [Nitrosomonas sp.]
MLHIEIRQKNGQYQAYSVDHSRNAPADNNKVLLPETDRWEKIFDNEGIEGRYILTLEQGRWKIKAGTPDLGGNSEESTIEIGTLFSKDDNILGIVIALFNAAPGQELLVAFSNVVSNGQTEPQLANSLAAHQVFTNKIIGGKSTAEQATELMNHFGLVADGVQGSAASIAQTFFTQSIASNVGYGVIAAQATFYLLSNPLLGNKVNQQFAPTSLLFKLKIFVADNYSSSNHSADLATLQEVLAGITLQVGTDGSDIIEGSSSGGVIDGSLRGDIIILGIAKNARDILLLNNVSDSQILDIDGGTAVTIRDNNNNLFLDDGVRNEARKFSVNTASTGDGIKTPNFMASNNNNNLFFDVVTNFSGGDADTDDLIDISSFNFTGTQAGLLDVTSRLSIDTDLTRVSDLFSGGIAGDHGVAFLEYLDEASRSTTYVFIDANTDGDFTAAEDMFLALVGVDDLTDANFIYTVGTVDRSAVFSLTAETGFVTEGGTLTYSITARETVAEDINVVFTVVAGDAATADQGTSHANVNDFATGIFNPITVTIPAGGTTATFAVTTLNDGLIENIESYRVNAAVGGETFTTTTSLLDRFKPFSLNASTDFVTEGDGLTYTVTANAAVAKDTDVVFSILPGEVAAADQGTNNTNLNDFPPGTFNPVTVTIPAGGTTASFSVTTLNDGVIELAENYSVRAVIGGETLTTTTTLLDGLSKPTFTLTTFTDNITGTSGDDIFNGFVGTAGTSTITGGDTVDGAGGTDTLNITNASGAIVFNTNFAIVSGIEILNLRGLTTADTFEFLSVNLPDVTEINGSLSLGRLIINDNDGVNSISTGAGNDVIGLTDKTSGTGITVTGGAGADAITTNMTGNLARDSMKFVYKAGDSVSDSSITGISATLTDTIANLDGAALSTNTGSSVEFDTEVQATAVRAGTTNVVLGTTAVTNAGDFFVNIENATTTWIYQDTDGDRIIEAGEFAVALTGIQSNTLLAADFTVSGGDLLLMTTVGIILTI